MSKILKPTTIIQPVCLEPNLEYRVERHGGIYLAGVSHAHFNVCGNIDADLYLDRLDGKKQVKLWKPKIENPFHIETKEIDKRVSEFYIEDMMLNWHQFETFVEKVNETLLYKHGKKIGYADAEAFFSQAYKHYKQIADTIQQ